MIQLIAFWDFTGERDMLLEDTAKGPESVIECFFFFPKRVWEKIAL